MLKILYVKIHLDISYWSWCMKPMKYLVNGSEVLTSDLRVNSFPVTIPISNISNILY